MIPFTQIAIFRCAIAIEASQKVVATDLDKSRAQRLTSRAVDRLETYLYHQCVVQLTRLT